MKGEEDKDSKGVEGGGLFETAQQMYGRAERLVKDANELSLEIQ